MREIRLNTEKELQRFLAAVEMKMSERDLDNKMLAEELGVAVQSIYNFRTDNSRKRSKYLAAKLADFLEIRPYEWR